MPAPDFPFVDGHPVALTARQWAGLMFAVAASFLMLYLPFPELPFGLSMLLQAGLFAALPLLTLKAFVGRHWRALFLPLSAGDIGLAIAIAGLNLCVAASVALGVLQLFGLNSNPAIDVLARAPMAVRVLLFVQSLPQLLGEELLTILPLLALLALSTRSSRLSRRNAIIVAWFGSSLLFALAHLPTYQWNLPQCLLVIGTARLILSLAYLRTRNLWVCLIAHVVSDWVLLIGALVGSGRA